MAQVRIDRRPTVGPTLLKLVQPCWPEVGPTSEMITLSVHWHLINDMSRIGSTMAQTWAD